MAEAIILVSNKICPFAHRAWLSLLEKEVPFTFREVDIINKEPWFT
jgi:glutathione S-transferase